MGVNDVSVNAERKSGEPNKLHNKSQPSFIIDNILDSKTVLGDISELVECRAR